eukprot:TRINITY_DN4347_c0_g1_i1.p1 TRINITY_DN4347_c0_g1~~TRINITY_DN4347_c0_g1_i1.p1  ORF type:complete len:2019 (+),score=564.89 TRINITY_DN4347_c0_g1_i1:84-6059(+)
MYATGLDDSFGATEQGFAAMRETVTSPYRQNPHPSFEDLETEYNRLRTANFNLRLQVLHYEETIEALGVGADVAEIVHANIQLKADAGQAAEVTKQLEERCRALKSDLAQREARARGVEAEMVALQAAQGSDAARARDRMAALEEDLAEKTEQLEAFRAQNASVEREVQALLAERGRWETDLEPERQARRDLDALVESLRQELAEVMQKRTVSEEEAEAARAAAATATLDLEAATRAGELAAARHAAQLRRLEDTVVELEAEVADRNGQLAELRDMEQLFASEAEVRTVAASAGVVKEAQLKHTKEVAALHDRIAEYEEAMALLENKAARKDTLLTEYHGSLQAMENELLELRTKYEDYVVIFEERGARVAHLEAEGDALEAALAERDHDVNTLQDALHDVDEKDALIVQLREQVAHFEGLAQKYLEQAEAARQQAARASALPQALSPLKKNTSGGAVSAYSGSPRRPEHPISPHSMCSSLSFQAVDEPAGEEALPSQPKRNYTLAVTDPAGCVTPKGSSMVRFSPVAQTAEAPALDEIEPLALDAAPSEDSGAATGDDGSPDGRRKTVPLLSLDALPRIDTVEDDEGGTDGRHSPPNAQPKTSDLDDYHFPVSATTSPRAPAAPSPAAATTDSSAATGLSARRPAPLSLAALHSTPPQTASFALSLSEAELDKVQPQPATSPLKRPDPVSPLKRPAPVSPRKPAAQSPVALQGVQGRPMTPMKRQAGTPPPKEPLLRTSSMRVDPQAQTPVRVGSGALTPKGHLQTQLSATSLSRARAASGRSLTPRASARSLTPKASPITPRAMTPRAGGSHGFSSPRTPPGLPKSPVNRPAATLQGTRADAGTSPAKPSAGSPLHRVASAACGTSMTPRASPSPTVASAGTAMTPRPSTPKIASAGTAMTPRPSAQSTASAGTGMTPRGSPAQRTASAGTAMTPTAQRRGRALTTATSPLHRAASTASANVGTSPTVVQPLSSFGGLLSVPAGAHKGSSFISISSETKASQSPSTRAPSRQRGSADDDAAMPQPQSQLLHRALSARSGRSLSRGRSAGTGSPAMTPTGVLSSRGSAYSRSGLNAAGAKQQMAAVLLGGRVKSFREAINSPGGTSGRSRAASSRSLLRAGSARSVRSARADEAKGQMANILGKGLRATSPRHPSPPPTLPSPSSRLTERNLEKLAKEGARCEAETAAVAAAAEAILSSQADLSKVMRVESLGGSVRSTRSNLHLHPHQPPTPSATSSSRYDAAADLMASVLEGSRSRSVVRNPIERAASTRSMQRGASTRSMQRAESVRSVRSARGVPRAASVRSMQRGASARSGMQRAESVRSSRPLQRGASARSDRSCGSARAAEAKGQMASLLGMGPRAASTRSVRSAASSRQVQGIKRVLSQDSAFGGYQPRTLTPLKPHPVTRTLSDYHRSPSHRSLKSVGSVPFVTQHRTLSERLSHSPTDSQNSPWAQRAASQTTGRSGSHSPVSQSLVGSPCVATVTKEEYSQLMEDYTNMTERMGELEEEMSEWRERAEEAEGKVVEWEQYRSRSDAAWEELSGQILTGLTGQLQGEMGRVDAANRQLKRLALHLRDMQQREAERGKEVEVLQQCIESHEAELAAAMDTKLTLEDEKLQLEFAVQRLKTDHELLKQTAEQHRKELAARRLDLEKAWDRTAALESSVQEKDDALARASRDSAQKTTLCEVQRESLSTLMKRAATADTIVHGGLDGRITHLSETVVAHVRSLKDFLEECGWGRQTLGLSTSFIESITTCTARCQQVLREIHSLGSMATGSSPPRGRSASPAPADRYNRAHVSPLRRDAPPMSGDPRVHACVNTAVAKHEARTVEMMVERLEGIRDTLTFQGQQRQSSLRNVLQRVGQVEEHILGQLRGLCGVLAAFKEEVGGVGGGGVWDGDVTHPGTRRPSPPPSAAGQNGTGRTSPVQLRPPARPVSPLPHAHAAPPPQAPHYPNQTLGFMSPITPQPDVLSPGDVPLRRYVGAPVHPFP